MATIKDTSYRLLLCAAALCVVASSFVVFVQQASAKSNIIRSTTYEVESGQFTGTTYTLNLNNTLAGNYFTMVNGPNNATSTRGPNVDQARISGDPFGNLSATTGTSQLRLTRGSASLSWIGSVTVVECLASCGTDGFQINQVYVHSMSAGQANQQQLDAINLNNKHSASTVFFGGIKGGGVSTTSTDANSYGVTVGTKFIRDNSPKKFDVVRYGAESRVPQPATFTVYIIDWGSNWTVQDAAVTGTNSGAGIDATGEYNTASITSVIRANSWVWGSGYTLDDGIGDGALGQVVTLGNGVTQNTTESVVAVGSEEALISTGRDFLVAVMTHSSINVDYRFKARGDAGLASGYQELTQTVNAPVSAEVYNNTSSAVRYSEGSRFPLLYTTTAGTGQTYSQGGNWGSRLTNRTTNTFWRAYSGQAVSGWTQVVDFGNVGTSTMRTMLYGYRWRIDNLALNTAGAWLASEDSVASSDRNKQVRLRMQIANLTSTADSSARNYQLRFATKTTANCANITSWTAVSAASDAFNMSDSTHISPDGQSVTSAFLATPSGSTYINGQGRDVADTSSSIGPLAANRHTELEYSLTVTNSATLNTTYCFSLYDTNQARDVSMLFYPQLTVEVETGTLNFNIVDSGGSPVVSPNAALNAVVADFNDAISIGTLGISSERFRVSNGTASPQWSAAIAATGGATAQWGGSGNNYDFNDVNGPVDGGDGDSLGGQLSVDPSVATISPEPGCRIGGVSSGAAADFEEGVIDSITLATAAFNSDVRCYWDITGIGLSQQIPAEQPGGSYSLSLTVTVTAF